MQPDLHYPAAQPFDLSKTSLKMHLSDVFQSGSHINEYNLFVSHFNCIPNFISEKSVDCKKAYKWFIETYKHEIKDSYYKKLCYDGSKHASLDDCFIFLYEDLIVNFDTNHSFARFLFKKTDVSKVEEIIRKINKFKNTRFKPQISLLINGEGGIETKALQITKPKLSIGDNYNDDFKEIHQTIIKRLSRKNDKGLILLHGKPGTGN